jgi:glutathione S-transferase
MIYCAWKQYQGEGMKLYYAKGACSLAVRIIINELGLTAEYESVDLKSKKTASEANYLTINAKGAVPALKLDNGEVLTEVATILQYLGDVAVNTKLLPLQADFNRYRVLEWLNYVATELHKSVGILFNPSIEQSLKEQALVPLIMSKLKYVDENIQHHQFLLGDHFTLPDAYLFVVLRWVAYFKLDVAALNNLTRYIALLKERPSIAKSLSEEGLVG